MTVLPLFDTTWATLAGGDRVPYDPSDALSRLEQGQDAWAELWNELRHQGDVGEASDAAVPHLVRIAAQATQRSWNFDALVSVIEVERHGKSNPPAPTWMADDHAAAMKGMQRLAPSDLPLRDDPLTVQAILAALALCRRQAKLGASLSSLDQSEPDALADEQLAWDERCDARPSGEPT